MVLLLFGVTLFGGKFGILIQKRDSWKRMSWKAKSGGHLLRQERDQGKEDEKVH